MSTALGYLFLLLPVAAIAGIVWTYRRKAGDKEARSREREATLVGLVQARDKAPRPAPAEQAGTGAPVPAPTAAATRRDRFLSQPETLVYYLLRTGMPGYEIFPRVSLASVATVARTASVNVIEQAQSTAHDLDFVVCDRSMRIVAAVQLQGRLAGLHNARVEQGLAAAGIRLVKIDPRALPKREQLGALVMGAAE